MTAAANAATVATTNRLAIVLVFTFVRRAFPGTPAPRRIPEAGTPQTPTNRTELAQPAGTPRAPDVVNDGTAMSRSDNGLLDGLYRLLHRLGAAESPPSGGAQRATQSRRSGVLRGRPAARHWRRRRAPSGSGTSALGRAEKGSLPPPRLVGGR